MKREQGFTLIELTLAMALVALLSVGATHQMRGWQQRQQLWQNALALRQFLQLVRDRAAAANLNTTINVVRNGAAWSLGLSDSPAQSGVSLRYRPSSPNIALIDMTTRLVFFGENSTAWSGHITLGNESGHWRVVVSAWGRIRLCRPQENTCQ